MNLASIKHLKKSLQTFGYHCEGGEEANHDLEVVLGKEDEGVWQLLLTFSVLPLEVKEHGKHAQFLQMFLSFPFKCEKTCTADVARLLLMLNKSLPFPAFGLSEVEGVIYYRNSLYCEKGVVPVALVCSLIGVLALYVDSLSPMIKGVATGQRQLHEVLKDVLALA
jgi:hypothetical protein